MEISFGGLEVFVAELILYEYKVSASFQMMSCISMSEGMDGGLFGYPSILASLSDGPLSRTGTIPLTFNIPIEEIFLRYVFMIILFKDIYQTLGDLNVPVLGTFTFSDPDLFAMTVYIIKGDIGGFAESEARRIDEGEEHLVFVSRGIINELDDILRRKCRW